MMKTLLITMLPILLVLSSRSFGAELATGASMAEDGNGIIRPAVGARIQVSNVSLLYNYHGRSYLGVEEKTEVLSLFGTKDFGRNVLLFDYGLSSVTERTKIEGDSATQDDMRQISQVPGVLLGVRLRPVEIGPTFIDLSWSSIVIPAGWAVIFLSHARMQYFSLSLGVSL